MHGKVININKQEQSQWNRLIWAGDETQLELLITKGVNISSVNGDGDTALHLAALYGNNLGNLMQRFVY